MKKATVKIEQVERKKAEVRIPENKKYHGIIKITKSMPPYKPEVRLSFTPFEKVNKKDKHYSKNSYTSSYVLTTNEGARLLCATFREAAKMLEESAGTLPSKSSAPASIPKE